MEDEDSAPPPSEAGAKFASLYPYRLAQRNYFLSILKPRILRLKIGMLTAAGVSKKGEKMGGIYCSWSAVEGWCRLVHAFL